MLKLALSRRSRGKTSAIAAAMALAASTMALAPAAHAATPAARTAPPAVTAPAGAARASAVASGRGLTVKGPDAVSCQIYYDAPFMYSGEPYGEGVEGLSYVQCTGGTVYALEVEAEIYYDNTGSYWLSGYSTQYDTSDYGNDVDAPLSAGDWQTCGGAYVWWTSTSDKFIDICSPETYIS